MDINNIYSSETNSNSTKENYYNDQLKNEKNLIDDLKVKGDEAFQKNEYEKAFNLYNQALQLESNDYDLIACLTGAALNLGMIDEVFAKTEFLIQLDGSKAQGYYLKGVAYDMIFKFDSAVDFFLKALDYETENTNIIVKNLIKTLVKFINKNDDAQVEESIDMNDTIECYLKLIELCDTLLRKSSNNEVAIRILKFVQKAEPDNFNVKSELLLVLGKFFKNQRNFDKAIITYEECCHLSSLNDDLRLKIKSLVSLSSCYLEMSDLHKVIYYYHKLIDIEAIIDSKTFTQSSSSFNSADMINLELRVAIRQNLFIAHYKLGKLRICCFYLDQIINLIDKNFNFFQSKSALVANSFDFIQIKIDASIELCKLYHIFAEFILMKSLLDKILHFIENIIDKANMNEFDQKQANSLRYFKIKCYSHLGICLAGLREFRLSRLTTRKSLCLVDRELSKPQPDLYVLNSLKLECLLDAVDAASQMLNTYREMKNFIFEPPLGSKDPFDKFEVDTLLEVKLTRVNLAKSAYLLSKSIIDPGVKAQAGFALAKSLYQNGQYLSAAYYFSQVISLLETHDKPKMSPVDNLFYSDASPDYKLESSVYLCKCQLLTDYYGVDFLAKSADTQSEHDPVQQDMENLYRQMVKMLEELIKHNLKWRLHETNRSSFVFNSANLEYLKQDKDSNRLRQMLTICSECLIYICYKLNKLEECLIYMELEHFVLDSNLNDLIDLKLIDVSNELNFESLNFDNFLKLVKLNGNFLIRYKFLFETKILFIFLIDGEQTQPLVFHSKIKTSLELDRVSDEPESGLCGPKIDYVLGKMEQIQNHRAKSRIQEFEYRSVTGDSDDLGQLRIKNRNKEKKYFFYLTESNVLYKFNFESIDLFSVTISEKLVESLEKFELNIEHQTTDCQEDVTTNLNLYSEIFSKFFTTPILKWLGDRKKCFSLLCDAKYSKLIVYCFNLMNKDEVDKIKYLVVLDSFMKYAAILLNSEEKEQQESDAIEVEKKEVTETPRRFRPLENGLARIHKSQIVPRYTSHPRAAVNLLNEDKNGQFVRIKNDHVQKIKNRLDRSVSVLITETASGTNAKRSHLEVIDYKQVFKPSRCCVMGCPDVPKKLANTTLRIDRFLKRGLDQLVQIASILKTEPIFGSKFTKKELIYQLETNCLIFLSSFSTNESDSWIICSQSVECPSSFYEFDKYCKFSSQDLDLIDMHRCNLLILNCYSALNHKPRFDLAKKILSRGCKSVLFVLAPLEDSLMTLFYKTFLENLKIIPSIDHAYCTSMVQFCQLNSNLDPIYLNNSFVLVSVRPVQLSLKEIIKSMLQLNVDRTMAKYQTESGTNSVNKNPEITILSPKFVSSLEKTLVYLQILVKFLLNDFIRDSEEKELSKNVKYEKIFIGLSDQIARSIYFIKSNKMGPEPLDETLDASFSSLNLLKCLGFGIQKAGVYKIRDEKDKKVLLYPDSRYLDLNLRLTHVMSSLVDMCFRISDEKAQLLVYNLEALLPIDDKNLLKCLIDVIALTKFSPDVVLNSTDYSIYYALNYFEYLNDKIKFRKLADLMHKDYHEWNFDLKNGSNDKIEIVPSDLCTKYSIGNKVVNFLLSIGYEIVGTWLRFNESDVNRTFLDLSLKFLSSFTIDRDMSLYKELNIHVLGQRSAVTRGLIRTASNLDKNDLIKKKDDEFRLKYSVPWCSKIETISEMEKKVEFSIRYNSLAEKISKQRYDALSHHINYVLKQSVSNRKVEINELNRNSSSENFGKRNRVKYKAGGNPSKDRIIANEKCLLTYDQIEEIRNYSYLIAKKNIEKIDSEFKEKSQKLLLPLIKK